LDLGVSSSAAPKILWRPSAEAIERSRMTDFRRWLKRERGLDLADYEELRRFSIADQEGFWSAIWDYFEIEADGEPTPVLAAAEMPGARWFPNVRLNYAERAFAGRHDDALAIVHASELRELEEVSWGELRARVAAAAAGLRASGVEAGDRVVAYMPNIVETTVALLATASIGAIWSVASPDFGAASVIDRFAQIEPKVLFAVDGYRYGGRDFDRLETVAELRRALPTLETTVLLPYLDPAADAAELEGDVQLWDELLGAGAGAGLRFERVPFDHPLWVLYSSGTTGLPKPIVHSQGGILVEHLKHLNLHLPAARGDRLFWFTTTGWMMWNFINSGLLTEAAIVLFDGNPGYPRTDSLWDFAARAGITLFGTSAAYITACQKAGVELSAGRDLRALKTIGSTGSPLPPEGFDWIYEQLGDDVWLYSTSGGTDLCTSFVGGVPILPVYRGEIQARMLGVAVEAWDEDGSPVVDEVGELVCTKPVPSMPIFFWGDEDGSRYREAYFERFPGVWRHGDWIEITSRGTAIIYGRSDATINRGGIRIGTSEIYRAVLDLDPVLDALVVDLSRPDSAGLVRLFVVLREGVRLDDELRAAIARGIRERCSPRHVPDEVIAIDEVPRTLSGKPIEVPVKRILAGTPVERAVSLDSLANPQALDFFVELAARDRG
jgi:acetoacetyl-CoA synthetase